MLFPDKQSGTCQKYNHLFKHPMLCGNVNIFKNIEMIQQWRYFVSFMMIIPSFSDSRCFGSDSRCSAGSQIFFLDKQFEICQKNLVLSEVHMCCEIQNIE